MTGAPEGSGFDVEGIGGVDGDDVQTRWSQTGLIRLAPILFGLDDELGLISIRDQMLKGHRMSLWTWMRSSL